MELADRKRSMQCDQTKLELLRARLFYQLDELLRTFGYDMSFAGAYRFDIDQICADTKRAGSGLYKIGGRFERHTAGRNKFDLRQRTFQVFDIACPANRSAWKNFYKVSTGAPGSHNFRRGQRTGHHRDPVTPAQSDGVQVQCRTYDKLRPRENTCSRCLRIKDCSRTYRRIGTILFYYFFNNTNCTGNGHR